MNKYFTEAIGTFFLVLVISLVGTRLGPIAIGSVLMVMVYMGGHISGAHYNPAVTISVWLRGKCSTADIIPYILAQMLGSCLAACVFFALKGSGAEFIIDPGVGIALWRALLVEFIFTFGLCLVVLNVATVEGVDGNSYYGLAIGFTVLASAYAGAAISGGAFNPAVGIGPNIMQLFLAAKPKAIGHTWLYAVGPFLGGILAAFAFKVMNPSDHMDEEDPAVPVV